MKTFIGVDPGLVNQGVIVIHYSEDPHTPVIVQPYLVGSEEEDLTALLHTLVDEHAPEQIFVEKFAVNRAHPTSAKMAGRVHAIVHNSTWKRRVKTISNTHIKSVVNKPWLALFKLDAFKTKSHHNDLLAAARILLLGIIREYPAVAMDVLVKQREIDRRVTIKWGDV